MDTEFVNWLAAQPFYALMVGLCSGALGILFGHWLSVGRDRRKEFNELALRLRSSIDKHLQFIDAGHEPISRADVELYIDACSRRRRKILARAWADYLAERESVDRFTRGTFYRRPNEIKRLLEALLALITPR